MIVCRHCQKLNPATAPRCLECGKRFTGSEEVIPDELVEDLLPPDETPSASQPPTVNSAASAPQAAASPKPESPGHYRPSPSPVSRREQEANGHSFSYYGWRGVMIYLALCFFSMMAGRGFRFNLFLAFVFFMVGGALGMAARSLKDGKSG